MKTILEYFEQTEKKYAHCTAVEDMDGTMTWAQLGRLSRQMGTAFARQGERGKPVVILAEKSRTVLAAMLGTVYAGNFYVMVDPFQPAARIKEILGVLEPELVVTEKKYTDLLIQTDFSKKTYFLEDAHKETIQEELLREVRSQSKGKDLLYGIFTSGSTGTPKGIVVSQKAAADFVSHFVETFGFTQKDRIGNQAPFDFDVSVKDIYTCIMTGATLVIIPRKLFTSPSLLLDYLCEKEVTVLIWAVSALTLVSSLKGLRYRIPHKVKKILFSGEVMPVRQLALWMEALPQAEFVNLYGPTEITCNCTYYRIGKAFDQKGKLPIGKPFPGRKVFLLDEEGREILDLQKTGEICVAGESLAEGYYRNPEETEKRFIEYSFREGDKQRCYCTGDLGYWGEEGDLYFSGRKDFQVKHMGHRIELEEIERTLEQVHGLERSCCIMDNRRNQLAAFYLGEALPGEIRKELKKKLPVYMIPHRLTRVSRMPLNKNGKTDRRYFRMLLEEGSLCTQKN